MFVEHLRKSAGQYRPEDKDRVLFVFDNARIHHSVETRTAIGEDGWKFLTIPPYSPELNLAEQFINQHKLVIRAELRKEK